MNRFILLTLLQMLSLNEAYNFTCPSPAHWTIRANSRCNPPRNYTCLFDVTFRVNVYRDKCNRPRILGPGYKYVFQPNLNRATCSFTRYQPFIFETNGYSDCTFQKSFCNSLGQKTYQNGNTTVDRKCICNSYKGYTFVRNLKNQCYCNPTTEDCSCYLGINPYNTTDGLKDIKCNHEMKMTRSPYLGDMFNISRIIKIIEFNNYKYNLNHLPTNEYRIEAAKWVLILSLAYVVVWIIILSVMRRWIQTRRTPRNFNIVECTDCSVTIAWFNDVPDECISYELDHRPRGTDDWSTQTFLSEDLLDEEDGRRMYKLQNLVPETYYEFKMRSVNNDVKRHYSESKTKQTLTLGVSNDDSIIETKEEISKPLDTSVYQQCSTTEPDGVSNDDSIIETKEETGKSRETSVNQQCRTTEPDGVLNADNLIESKEEIGKPPDSSDNQQCSTTEPDGASNAEYMIETREEIGKTSDCSVHQQCSTTDPDGASNAEYMIETKEEIGKTPDCSVHQQCSTTDPDEILPTKEEPFKQVQTPVKCNLPVSVICRKQIKINKFFWNKNLIILDCIKIGNKLVFTDCENDRLIICSADGTDIRHIHLSFVPEYITDIGSNTVVVSCYGVNIIHIINISTRSVTSTINTSGYCYGISYNENNLYVVIDQSIIHVMDLTGNEIRTIPLPSDCITDITVDRDRLVCIDGTSIYCCSLDGKLIWKFTKDKYQYLRGVTTDDEDNVYVTDVKINTVVVVYNDGKHFRDILTELDGLNQPRGIYFDKKENVLLVSNALIDGKAFLFEVKKNLTRMNRN